MNKPNLVKILQNEKRLQELKRMIPALKIEYELIPNKDVGQLSRMQSRLDELNLEYQERILYKKDNYHDSQFKQGGRDDS